MSNKNEIEEIIFSEIKKYIKSISFRSRRFWLIHSLHTSKNWKRDYQHECWYTVSAINNEQAAIYDQDINTWPELCAGFATYHDPSFESPVWAERSLSWTAETVPITPSHADEMHIDAIVEDFMAQHPWAEELDNSTFNDKDEDE